jgi:hypothetical protein
MLFEDPRLRSALALAVGHCGGDHHDRAIVVLDGMVELSMYVLEQVLRDLQ